MTTTLDDLPLPVPTHFRNGALYAFSADQIRADREMVWELAMRKALEGREPVEYRRAVMGEGRVAIGCCINPDTGTPGIIYLDMGGAQRPIDADTSDLFEPGKQVDPSKILACVHFLTAEAVHQTIGVLHELLANYFGVTSTPPNSDEGPMTTHQDTSTERDLVANMRVLEADHEPDGWPAVRMSTISALCDEIERLRAALASRDEGVQPAKEKIAPVQGYTPGIPWSMHLEAYDVYRNRWGAQPALIDLDGRNCRGGFSVRELDEFIPGWRDRLSELVKLREEVTRLRSGLASQQPQGQAVSDEQIIRCFQEDEDDHTDASAVRIGRAILALRDKPATSPDGTPNNAV